MDKLLHKTWSRERSRSETGTKQKEIKIMKKKSVPAIFKNVFSDINNFTDESLTKNTNMENSVMQTETLLKVRMNSRIADRFSLLFGMCLAAVVCVSFLLSGGLAHAGVIYEDSFTGDSGDLPTDWVQAYHASQSTNNTGLFNDAFRIEAEGDSSFASFSLDDSVGGAWEDYKVETTFEASRDFNIISVYGRWDGTTVSSVDNPIGGYQVSLRPSADTMYLTRDIGGGYTGRDYATELDSTSVTGLQADTPYTIELDFQGNNITGTLSDDSGNDLATVSATDSTYTSGSVGLGSGFSYENRENRFESITVIPEPSSMMLLVLGGLLMMKRRRL